MIYPYYKAATGILKFRLPSLQSSQKKWHLDDLKTMYAIITKYFDPILV